MRTVKLAEALLRRKELQQKVDTLKQINQEGLFEVKYQRKKISDDVDDLTAIVPKITLKEVRAGFDYYASQLRKIDAIIQQANWTTEIEVDDNAFKNHQEDE